MLEWLFGSKRRNDRTPDPAADCSEFVAEWDSTSRQDWTVPDTYFQSFGWKLQSGTGTQMTWTGKFGGTMTFTRDSAPAWTADDFDLDASRRKHRSAARARDGGLVSAEFVTLLNGAPALEVITKHRSGFGYRFEGRLFIDESPSAYTIALDADELQTGARESMVTALQAQLGEIDIDAILGGPADPVTGLRRVPGMRLDPYDAAFDDEATCSPSDDPRLDDVFRTHPLALIRLGLLLAARTWQCATHDANRVRPAFPASPGPRVVLSDNFFEALRTITERG